MLLNLIRDSWIPVRLSDGRRRLIAPHDMVDPAIVAPDWPRADLNLACYELLIGLVFMASPPADLRDWARHRPTQAELKSKLAPFAEAFDLLGEGPRFMQDLEELKGEIFSPDLLFLDSAGENTASKNADLMVRRSRYQELDLGLAAMAIYALQQFAKSGGPGHRTSMRGGGPLVTLANPGTGIWDLIWANVPFGQPASISDLPWMKPCRTSEGSVVVHDSDMPPVEAFFGMPWRLKLVGDQVVTGVLRQKHGVNYGQCRHPLTPYRRKEAGKEIIACHPHGSTLNYRNWIGIVLADPQKDSGRRMRAACIEAFFQRFGRNAARMIVGGWSVDKWTPVDFLWSELPLLNLGAEAEARAEDMVEAASLVASQLRKQLSVVLAEGSAREAQLDQFWLATEADFTQALAGLSAEGFDAAAISKGFLAAISRQARAQFEAVAVPGIADGKIERAEKIVTAHRNLNALLAGRSKLGRKLWDRLGLTPPDPKAKSTEEIDA